MTVYSLGICEVLCIGYTYMSVKPKVYGPAAHTEVYVKNTQHVQKAGIPRNQTGVYYKLQSLTTCCAHMKNTPSLHRNKPRIIHTSINIKGVF